MAEAFYGRAHAAVCRQCLRVQFRIAAAQVQALHIFREGRIAQRAEGHELGPGIAKHIEIVGVVKTEGRISGQADAHRFGLGPLCRHGHFRLACMVTRMPACMSLGIFLSCLGREPQEQVHVQVFFHQTGQGGEGWLIEGIFFAHVQAQVARGNADGGFPGQESK